MRTAQQDRRNPGHFPRRSTMSTIHLTSPAFRQVSHARRPVRKPVPARVTARPVRVPAQSSVQPSVQPRGELRLTRRGRLVVTLLMLAVVLVALTMFSGYSAATHDVGTPQ